ncbi:hypothetical protein [Acidovorax sp. RAC01]|uniref:hypothetical protein n=1 Tax=Acidovorax sp. RAC01 TaxID=1842533 RepID=UPI0008580917|nr:hypothetical protein BSY15_4079 [Acidovorax sp. RAC01]
MTTDVSAVLRSAAYRPAGHAVVQQSAHAVPGPGRLGAACAAAALIVTVALTGCSSTPPTPDWQMNAHGAVQKATQAYLAGQTRVELLEWNHARAEVGRTGRVDLLARVELTRCAAQVASLDPAPCDRFEALRPDAPEAERAYADYLAGRPVANAVAQLPEAQRAVASTGSAAALAAIQDPLSRLVAAGVLFKTGAASPAVASIAMETASGQGWRRPLMAWLALEARRAQAAGDAEAAAALQRRLAVVEGSPGTR